MKNNLKTGHNLKNIIFCYCKSKIGYCKSKINFCDPNASKLIKNSFSSGDSLTLSSRRYTKLSGKKICF